MVGVEVCVTLAVDPLVDDAVGHDVSVPGRLVTGVEESELDEPELAREVRKFVSVGRFAVSPGSHGRGGGERTDVRKEDVEVVGSIAADVSTVNEVFDDEVAEVR